MSKPQKLFYSLREVAKEVGEPSSTIKYWGTVFDGIEPHYTPGGTRRYRREDLDRLRIIRTLLKERRLTISGARAELAKRGSSLERRQEVILRLKSCLEQLRELADVLSASSPLSEE